MSLLPAAGAFAKNHFACRIPGDGPPGGMQCFKKCDERGYLRRVQIVAVCGHVAAPLDHLADELVQREPYSNTVESRTSLPATVPLSSALPRNFTTE